MPAERAEQLVPASHQPGSLGQEMAEERGRWSGGQELQCWYSDYCDQVREININKGGLTTRFDPPPNGLRELKLHRSSTNVCTKTKMFLKIFFDIRFRSEGA